MSSLVEGLAGAADMDRLIRLGVDIAAIILVVEALVLGLFRWRTGRGLPYASIAVISISGLGLLLAVKAALLQAGSHWIGLGLTIGGIAHAIDLMRRLRA